MLAMLYYICSKYKRKKGKKEHILPDGVLMECGGIRGERGNVDKMKNNNIKMCNNRMLFK